MKIKYLLILSLALFILSGCSSVPRTVTIEPKSNNAMTAKCRLDHYSCNESQFFTPGMEVMRNLLQEFTLKSEFPELAEIGLSCDLDIVNKVSQGGNGKAAWFITMELEFYNLPDNTTIRKTVLKGHGETKNAVIELLADMAGRFFEKLGPARSIEVELASAKSEFDKKGCEELLAGNYGKAITEFRKAIDKSPNDHCTRYNLGLTYEKMGRIDQAEICYKVAYDMAGLEMYRDALKRVQQ